MNTSSSLAFALGDPSGSPGSVHGPERSAEFFDCYLEQKAQGISSSLQSGLEPQMSPMPQTGLVSQESPDPLALNSPILKTAQTPRKRKPVVEIDSPAKRFQLSRLGTSTPILSTRAGSSPSTSKQPLKKSSTLAYVEIPPSPWLSPSSRKLDHSSSQVSSQGRQKTGGINLSVEFGGYGSDCSPTKLHDTVKSSARRTGDRDERGAFEKNQYQVVRN
jgi:cohesin loading factor subunit SCC2